MIEKAKKYLLEHNVLWINPEEREKYLGIDHFYIPGHFLVFNVANSNLRAFLSNLGDYHLENDTSLQHGYACDIRIENKLIGIFFRFYQPQTREVRIHN